jgi:DNA-binding NtrC family response regulator
MMRYRAKQTVLLVHDDPAILFFVAKLFVHDEYNILTASSGTDGIRQSREFRDQIDLLFADCQMSGMSGIDLANAITRERPGLKVLLMSGYPPGGHRTPCDPSCVDARC